MKKFVQLTCIAIPIEVFDDGPIFSSIACRQARDSFVSKYRQTEVAKTKVSIFVYKTFTNSFFKSYKAIEI